MRDKVPKEEQYRHRTGDVVRKGKPADKKDPLGPVARRTAADSHIEVEKMIRRHHAARRAVWVGLLAVFLGPHAMAPARAADPVPEFYGFYGVSNGRLVEFKEGAELPDLSAGVRFIYFGKDVGSFSTEMRVERMKYLRKTINPDASPSEKATNRWYVTTDAAREIELRAKPVPGQPEMVTLVPREALANGAYALYRGKTVTAQFFVGKAAVIANLQTSPDCVDHVYESNTDEQFSFNKVDRRAAGGGYAVVQCSQSASSASGDARVSPSSTTRSGSAGQATTNGAGGTASQTAGTGVPAGASEQARLSSLIAELMRRPMTTPSAPDLSYTTGVCGASFSYPAGWELMPEKSGPVLATVVARASDNPLEARTQISVTCGYTLAGLASLVNGTVEATRKTLTPATISGPVTTTLAGVEAQIFFVTGMEAGRHRQKAVTVAVRNGNALGVILHATPATFEDAWDEYQRVAASYMTN